MKNLANAFTFLEVARQGSFVSASGKLGISTSATSKAVARLEEELGIKLLRRTTRSVTLTPEGENFLEGIQKLQAELNNLTEEMTAGQNKPAGRLRISVPPLFGRNILLPLMRDFLDLYPELQVEMSFETERVSLAAGGYDIAIRAGELEDSANLVARKLLDTGLITCASKSYLDQRGQPQTPEDLLQHNCLVSRSAVTGKIRPWEYEIDGQRQAIDVTGSLVLDDFEAVARAAKQGAGIAQIYDVLVTKSLQTGAMVEVLHDYAQPTTAIYLVYLDRKLVSSRIRAFINYVVEALQSTASLT